MPVDAPTSHTVLPRQSLMGRLWGMVMVYIYYKLVAACARIN
jgi:hypothetical protein